MNSLPAINLNDYVEWKSGVLHMIWNAPLLGCNGSHNKFTSIHKPLNVTVIEWLIFKAV